MEKLKPLISRLLSLKYYFYNTVKKQSGVAPAGSLPVIISLTTYPPRLKTVFLTIESLLNQTLKPHKIVLWLSSQEINTQDIPKNLLKLKPRGLEIRFVDENIKSYKKLIYALAEFSHCLIVTADDDFLYPHWFLQGLYQSYQQYPDCISAYRCRMMSRNNGQLSSYNSWQFATQKHPSTQLFPTTGGGALYPPNSLNKKAQDRAFIKLCPLADDIWFKAASLLNNTKVVMVKETSIDFPIIYTKNSQQQTLWQKNITQNNPQIKAVFDYFDLPR